MDNSVLDLFELYDKLKANLILETESEQGQQLNHTLSAGTIFGSTVEKGYALVSCTVVPGFDFSEFKLFTKTELINEYPAHESIIQKLAYNQLPE